MKKKYSYLVIITQWKSDDYLPSYVLGCYSKQSKMRKAIETERKRYNYEIFHQIIKFELDKKDGSRLHCWPTGNEFCEGVNFDGFDDELPNDFPFAR